MKKILIGLVLLVSIQTFGQDLNYTKIAARYKWIAGLFDSSFGIPTGPAYQFRFGGSRRAGQVFYDSTGADSGFYVSGRAQTWHRLARADEAGAIDTTNKWIQTMYVRNDSLFYRKDGNETFVKIIQSIFSDYWTTDVDENIVTGTSVEHGYNLAGITPLAIFREGIQHDIVLTGTPDDRQARYVTDTIQFDPTNTFGAGETVFVIFRTPGSDTSVLAGSEPDSAAMYHWFYASNPVDQGTTRMGFHAKPYYRCYVSGVGIALTEIFINAGYTDHLPGFKWFVAPVNTDTTFNYAVIKDSAGTIIREWNFTAGMGYGWQDVTDLDFDAGLATATITTRDIIEIQELLTTPGATFSYQWQLYDDYPPIGSVHDAAFVNGYLPVYNMSSTGTTMGLWLSLHQYAVIGGVAVNLSSVMSWQTILQ